MHCGLIPQFKESFALQGGGSRNATGSLQCRGIPATWRGPCIVEGDHALREGGGEVLKAGQSYDAKGFLQC